MNRRDFIKFITFMSVGMKVGLLSSVHTFANPIANISAGLKGSLVAACMNPKMEGAFSRQTHDTVLSRLNLETGTTDMVPLELQYAHDALKVKDRYLVIPNAGDAKMCVSDFSGANEILDLGGDRYVSGHGFHDDKENTVIVSVTNLQKGGKGEFAVFDADNYQLLDFIETEGYSPHDIQLLDENTLAVCNYNQLGSSPDEGWTGGKLLNGTSSLLLFDRKTLKLKENISAYKNAMVSHAQLTSNGDLYAIGFNEFKNPDVEKWQNEYIKDKFSAFFEENQPELSSQWPDIAQHLKIAPIEKSIRAFGIPLLPLKLGAGDHAFETLPFEHFHHRRAQSICYVRQSNTVCMAFPFSNSVLLYNATTGTSRNISGADLNLQEVRGISEIEGTTYLAIAGIRRGISIIDTASEKNIQHYDVRMGRIIHMHHVV